MATVSMYLAVTFVAAMVAVAIRLPPLVGFLAAGFVLNGIGVEQFDALTTLADLGVTLLLFGIGLKLDVRSLIKREVWLTSAAHMGLTVVIGLGLLAAVNLLSLPLLARTDFGALVLIAFALSFSSTVFVVKVLSGRSESQSHYGRVAIGVLIMQDIAAVVFLTALKGSPPSPWALALLLLIPGAWVIRKVWDMVPHGEMQALFGIVMALVPGYAAFELVGLKGDLGALIVGALLAGHPAAGELSKSLFTIKELLLVGFFISIGLGAMPTGESIVIAILLMVLIPIKTASYFFLLAWQRLGHRSAILTSLALGNFSEFALIVAAVGVEGGLIDEQWLVVLSVAVALSFVISAITNRTESKIVSVLVPRLPMQDATTLHPEDRPIDLSRGNAVVLGMGRIGRAAYHQLEEEYGQRVVGVENNINRVQELVAYGLDVQEADATDAAFWERVSMANNVRLVVLAMPFHGSNLAALRNLRDSDFAGRVAAVAQYDDEVADVKALGADSVLQLYSGAGIQLADEAFEVIAQDKPPSL
ncbi:cation:proton antiporter [Ornithinimicrobium sp. Arc0846-15]|nr:cation:proton antiporter [Ornithinimicrobium laminariae]